MSSIVSLIAGQFLKDIELVCLGGANYDDVSSCASQSADSNASDNSSKESCRPRISRNTHSPVITATITKPSLSSYRQTESLKNEDTAKDSSDSDVNRSLSYKSNDNKPCTQNGSNITVYASDSIKNESLNFDDDKLSAIDSKNEGNDAVQTKSETDDDNIVKDPHNDQNYDCDNLRDSPIKDPRCPKANTCSDDYRCNSPISAHSQQIWTTPPR